MHRKYQVKHQSSSWFLVTCSSESKVKFRQADNHYKRVLEAAKLVYASKTKVSITFQKSGSQDFWQIPNSNFNKSKSAITPLFSDTEVLFSAYDKAKLTSKKVFKNSDLRDPGISLPAFPSRINQKLHNIFITLKLVNKVITNLDLSKASDPKCIPVVLQKELWTWIFINTSWTFTIHLREYCIPDCWKVSSGSLYLRMLVKGARLKTTVLLVFLLWLVKFLKNL